MPPTVRSTRLSTDSQVRNTTFVISNLHCQSCILNIEDALFGLHPRPSLVSHSIVSQSVTICHHPSLLASTISKSLDVAGFEIDSVIQDPTADADEGDTYSDERNLQQQNGLLERIVKKWKPIHVDKGENKKARHIGRCDLCHAQGKEKPYEQEPSPSMIGTLNEPFVVVDSRSSSLPVKATLSIVGMTCGTCVGKISEALEAKPWSRSVDVNLLNNSAVVTVEDERHLVDVIQAIEDIGYEPTLERVDRMKASQETTSETSQGSFRASYAVGGMTCSTCIGNITEALQKYDWIKRIDINLISNSATIMFVGKDHLEQIADAIEDVGYEATLNDVIELGQRKRQDRQRVVSVRVTGMYCDHCPSRIHDSLGEFGQRVAIEKELSVADPIMKIRYTPSSPDFTIRHILASISTVSPSLAASIYHPPTLEERSRIIHAREQQRLLLRAALSIIIAIPTFIIAIVFGSLVPSNNQVRQFFMHPIWSGQVNRADWALFFLATPVYFLAADVFHRRALKEVRALWRRGSATPILQRFYRFGSMNTLMSLGTSIAYISSIVQLALAATSSSNTMSQSDSSIYFDSVVFLTMFLLVGKLIESYSRSKTGDAVTMLGKLRPTEAVLVDPPIDDAPTHESYSGQRTRQISVDLLEFGDIVGIPHGGSPPCDGYVVEGESEFDESSLTGESEPVHKVLGDEVFSGAVNKEGPVSIRISGVAGASMLDQIIQVVREGQARRAPLERLADVLTSYFVPSVTLIAVSTWIIWLSLGLSGTLPLDYLDIQRGGWPLWSLQFAIAVFVIACPCGIALAAPTALFVGGGLAARHGILVKGGGEAFQEASELDCIVFDKTGTLTQGNEPVITDHKFLTLENTALTLTVTRMLEESSSHPVAKAVVSFCNSKPLAKVKVKHIEEIAGKGMKGTFITDSVEKQDVEVIVGNEALMADHGVAIPTDIANDVHTWKAEGKSIVLVSTNVSATWNLGLIFAASDPLRPEASATIHALKNRGIDIWMISGDNPTTAAAIGAIVGIPKENIIAGVLPAQKAEKIRYLQKSLKKRKSPTAFGKSHEYTQRRATVAMVGDGINDSPALTVADVGIAIGSGSDIAISSAEFILVSSRLDSLLTLIDLSRTVFRRIKFNFAWALVYNLIALPVAAGVLYPVRRNGDHVRLDPVWASLAMALSSVSVVCSSLLLKSTFPGVGFRQRPGFAPE